MPFIQYAHPQIVNGLAPLTIEVGKDPFIILAEVPLNTVLIFYLGLSPLQLNAQVIVPLFW